MSDKKQPKPKNVHAATDAAQCSEMGKRNQWKLREVRPNGHPILKVDCIFEGEQTSFEDTRYD